MSPLSSPEFRASARLWKLKRFLEYQDEALTELRQRLKTGEPFEKIESVVENLIHCTELNICKIREVCALLDKQMLPCARTQQPEQDETAEGSANT